MATYSTDLTTITTAEAGTWTEFAAPYNGGGNPGASGENFIQGTDCFAQNTGKAVGLEISTVFDNGSNYTFGTGDVLFAWLFYAIGTNLETYANNGWRLGIGSSTSAWSWYRIGGSDYGRNPYGGWTNIAVDPTATATGTIGGGNGGNYRYFGNVPYTLNEVSKGDPVAVDALREGRGEISVTGSGGSFSELAEYNDYNSGGTPPGTSSTSVDSGRHVLGLFQASGGTYLWKGLLSLGLTGTSVTFSDSNETIIIDDCPHTYAEFNKVEINNASSSVTLTNITFTSTATTTIALGRFEVVDNATVTLNGCSFNAMDTFIFQSNTTASGCVWNSCGAITAGGASLAGSSITDAQVGTDGSALIWNVNSDPDGELDDMTFTKGTDTAHAIEFGTNVPTTMTLTGIDFNGYNASDGQNDSTFYFKDTSPTSITLNLSGCTGNVSYKTDGANITIVNDPVTISQTVSTTAGVPIINARVLIEATDATGDLPYDDTVTISRTGDTATVSHTAHGMVNGDIAVIRRVAQREYAGPHVISNVSTDAYDYILDSPYPTTPATGLLVDLTDAQDETSYDNSPTTDGIFTGGNGYIASEVLNLQKGISVTVDAVDSGGTVTEFTVDSSGQNDDIKANSTLTQVSSGASGSLSVISTDFAAETAASTSLSKSITLPSGTNRKLLVWGGLINLSESVSSIIYDGNIMSFINSTSLISVRQYLYYFDISDSDTGSKTVTVNYSTSVANRHLYLAIIENAATGAVDDNDTNTTAAATSLSTTMTSTVADALFIQGTLISDAAAPFSPGSPATEELEQDLAGGYTAHIISEIVDSASTNSLNSVFNASGNANANGAIIKPISVGGSGSGFTLTPDTGNLDATPIKATGAFIHGLTDSSGSISRNRVISNNTPIISKSRKATSSPVYKSNAQIGTVSNINGLSISTQLILDE